MSHRRIAIAPDPTWHLVLSDLFRTTILDSHERWATLLTLWVLTGNWNPSAFLNGRRAGKSKLAQAVRDSGGVVFS